MNKYKKTRGNKKHLTKRHRNKKYKRKTRGNKKYLTKRHRKHYGGGFNQAEKARLRKIFEDNNFTAAQITELLKLIDPLAQRFSSASGYFEDFADGLEGHPDFNSIREWVIDSRDLESDVETDEEYESD
jgi:hypothetical protein